MSLSNYEWFIVYDDGSTQIVHAESIEEVLEKIESEQPRAIIKGGFAPW